MKSNTIRLVGGAVWAVAALYFDGWLASMPDAWWNIPTGTLVMMSALGAMAMSVIAAFQRWIQ